MLRGLAENAAMKVRPAPPPKKRKPRSTEPGSGTGSQLHIGQWIAFMGLTQAEVARESGVNEGYLSQLISGKYDKDPRVSMLDALSDAIGVETRALFGPPPPREQFEQFRAIRERPKGS